MGAASPGRWQPWQFFCKTGNTFFWNVIGAGVVVAAAAIAAQARLAMNRRIRGLASRGVSLFMIREKCASASAERVKNEWERLFGSVETVGLGGVAGSRATSSPLPNRPSEPRPKRAVRQAHLAATSRAPTKSAKLFLHLR